MSPAGIGRKTNLRIKKAEAVRNLEHRLRPSLRLKSRTEIVDFVQANQLVSVLGGNELPSLIGAVLGRPWKPSSKGFTGWLDWWSIKIEGQRLARVFGELERRNDILASRIFRHSKTFISNKLWPTLNPIILYYKRLLNEEGGLSVLQSNILSTIDSEGSIRTDRLRTKLRLEGKRNNYRFHHALANLENPGLIVGAEDPRPERHLHANIWQTWKQRAGSTGRLAGTPYTKAFEKLVERTIDTCVLVRETQIRNWYPWRMNTESILDRLLNRGAVTRVGAYLIPSRIL